MTATILKIQKEKSKTGGYFWYIFFKEVGTLKSFRACVYEHFRNFQNWRDLLTVDCDGWVLTNLQVLNKGNSIVDADSEFKILSKPPKTTPSDPDVLTADRTAESSPKPILAKLFCDFCKQKFENEIVSQISVACDGTIIRLNAHSGCLENVYKVLQSGTEFEINEMNDKLVEKARAKK